MSGSALKLIASRRRKIYKTASGVRRRDVRSHTFPVVISNKIIISQILFFFT